MNPSKETTIHIAVFGGSFSVIEPSKVAKAEWCKRANLVYDDYGVGGTGFVKGDGDAVPAQIDRALASGKKYDAFVLWASTNDVWGEDKIQRQNESIEACVRKIRDAGPGSKVLFLTSMPIPLIPENPILLKYADNQAETCRRLGVPVLEQHRLISFPMENTEQYFQADRLHPTEKGYDFIKVLQADFMVKELRG